MKSPPSHLPPFPAWVETVGLALSAVMALVLCAATIVLAFHAVALGVPSFAQISTADAISQIGSVGTGAAVFAAVWQFLEHRRFRASEFAMHEASRGLEEAYTALLEGTDRAAWIQGGRILMSALATGDTVLLENHKVAWRLKQFVWRPRFFELLKKPVAFFFGLPDADDGNYSDQALQSLATRSNQRLDYSLPGISGSRSPIREHARSALMAIWEFAEFPDDYEDTLNDRTKVTRKVFRRLRNAELFSLYAFLNWRRRIGNDGRLREGAHAHPDLDPDVLDT